MENTEIQGWSYEVYPGDIESLEFGPFQSLIDLWRAKGGEDALPEWRDFELEDFSMWWGRLSLATILNDPFDIEFPLWGTTLTEWWGIDFTKKKMNTVYKKRQENWKNFEGPYIQSLIDNKGIGFVQGDLRVIDRKYLTVQGIDLPLMKDGNIKQILSGYRAIKDSGPTRPACAPLWTK